MTQLAPYAGLLGAVATAWGVLGAASSLLQARKLARTQSAESVSVGFLAKYLGGYVTWALYGMAIESTPLIVVDLIGICASSLTVFTAVRVRRVGTRTNGSHGRGAASRVQARNQQAPTVGGRGDLGTWLAGRREVLPGKAGPDSPPAEN